MEKKNNFILGIVGGVIGGIVATIPWVIMYVYGNMILSLLAILIAMGVLKGYQLFKGKEDKKLPIIVIVISVLCVTVATLVVIPLMLLAKEGINASFDNLKILYNNSEFFGALMKDYVISVIFTFLGISGVVSSIKKKLKGEVVTKEQGV